MTGDDNIIITDNPLNNIQKDKLSSLLEVLIPASDDGMLPSAAELDFLRYLQLNTAEAIPALVQLLDGLDEQFSTLSKEMQNLAVEQFSTGHGRLFKMIVLQVFACYYQNEQVQKGLRMEAGPLFPRGNDVKPNDLSLLDPVIARSHSYRKTK
ncbi:MAG: hypothetical protein JKY67_20905 [Pseudomonadales bacterium]|nr:hypothetical protein [Pseudomonadales bacterium]